MVTRAGPTATFATEYLPRWMNPPSAFEPSSGWNPIAPSSTRTPSTWTVPVTVTFPLPPQPRTATSSAAADPPAAARSRRMVPLPGCSIIAERLAAVHRAQRLPGGYQDAVADEPQRAVAHGHVDAALVPAAGRTLLGPRRDGRLGRVEVRARVDPVDDVRHGGIGAVDGHELEDAVVVHDVA